ncbi:MAG TPA: glycoside hydrolase family 16 protein [Candidatus Acidoferrales bacterium]|jgi:beta-glucanase (GH16 family)|nr:glycoside hydrolase family 16 protein [Candidatus Acidoferrales bacterium]
MKNIIKNVWAKQQLCPTGISLYLYFILIVSALAARSANNWTLVWHDEFNKNGPPDPANWTYENGFVRNSESQWYQPENAYCTNGLLIIEARREHRRNPGYEPGSRDWRTSREWIAYTSASLTTKGLHEFKYGKFQMRARIDTRPGSWPAFWTLGAGFDDGKPDASLLPWPDCGEIDIMEYYAGNVLANFAYRLPEKRFATWSAVKNPIKQFDADNWSREFHVWTMEWDEKEIDLLLDGRPMNHLDVRDADKAAGGNPFKRPLYLKLNQAIGGTQGGDPSHTAFPIRFEIDWVRVYQQVSPGK